MTRRQTPTTHAAEAHEVRDSRRAYAAALVDRLHTALHAGDHDAPLRACDRDCCGVCRTADAGLDDDEQGTEVAS